MVRGQITSGFGSVKIVIGIAVAALIGGYFFFVHPTCEAVANDLVICQSYFQKQQGKSQERNRGELVDAGIPADTSLWKTYRNEEYGFEIQYPSSFKLDEYTHGDTKVASFLTGETQIERVPYYVSFDVIVDRVTRKEVNNKFRIPNSWDLEPETLGKYTWDKYVESGMGDVEFYTLWHEGVLYRISRPSGAGDEKIFKAMISTFKFIK